MLHRFDENMGTEGLRQSAKLSETFGIIRICLLTSDRQEFARFANVGDLNGKTERTEIPNHLSADTGLDGNRLRIPTIARRHSNLMPRSVPI